MQKVRQTKVLKLFVLSLVAVFLLPALAGCGQRDQGNSAVDDAKVLKIGGIPDQDVAQLEKQFNAVAKYLSEELGIKVEYVPSVDYAALLTAFERGEIHLAWFGGLTGVQAQAAVPGAEAIAQRPRDAKFHSVFIKQSVLPIEKLEDLKGKTFTFGSESSTSGHLMPRFFLKQAGIVPEKDFNGGPNYSGSHDKTYKLVETGAFQAGALNEAVWEKAVQEGKVDTSKVQVFYTTPDFFDYNWTVNANVDEEFGQGTKEKIKEALLSIGPEQSEILELFQTDSFVETKNENYDAIREVAKELGIIK
ncbi:putative selenate ABC transporter substrate-binding protein [Zhaonella formicivorans]|uniref:putative selenate ABC transporter substrate-binding protein n=1 Tax=Zhaonella formicivorans TaxID=2528593 RepID=UPI0010CE646C|nr:putative selenate ABC transporter substrate-binding protein [Zhaonella formicivorans]